MQGAVQHGLVRYAGELDGGPCHGQGGELGPDRVEQPLAPGAEHATGEDDQLGVEHGHDRRETEGDPVCERLEQLVAGPCGRPARAGRPASGLPARSPSRRASSRTCLPPASSWKPPALLRPTSRTSGVLRQRQEADLARAAGGAAVQHAVDDDRGAQALLGPQQDEVRCPAPDPRAARRRPRG